MAKGEISRLTTPLHGEKQQSNRLRSNQPPFLKVTCWNFQKGCFCGGGCKLEHKHYKCSAKHPATRCNVEGTRRCPIFLPNRLGASWQITPIEVDRLDHILNGYPFHLRSYLIESFNFDFQEHFEGERGIFERSQVNSAIAQQDMVRDELCKKLMLQE